MAIGIGIVGTGKKKHTFFESATEKRTVYLVGTDPVLSRHLIVDLPDEQKERFMIGSPRCFYPQEIDINTTVDDITELIDSVVDNPENHDGKAVLVLYHTDDLWDKIITKHRGKKDIPTYEDHRKTQEEMQKILRKLSNGKVLYILCFKKLGIDIKTLEEKGTRPGFAELYVDSVIYIDNNDDDQQIPSYEDALERAMRVRKEIGNMWRRFLGGTVGDEDEG